MDNPLISAILKDPEKVPSLLEAGADVNTRYARGQTPLMVASSREPEIIPLLIQAGANINAWDDRGRTALMNAAEFHPEAVSMLLNAGADVHHADKHGWTAIAIAAGHQPVAVPLLLEAGANVNDSNGYGWNALLLAVWKHPEITPLLIEAGANVNSANKRGETPLIMAVKHTPEVIPLLLEAGADVNASDRDGWTALMHAIRNDQPEAVTQLLDAGTTVTKDAIQVAEEYNRKMIPLLRAGDIAYHEAINYVETEMFEEKEYIPERLLMRLGISVEGYEEFPDLMKKLKTKRRVARRCQSQYQELAMRAGEIVERAIMDRLYPGLSTMTEMGFDPELSKWALEYSRNNLPRIARGDREMQSLNAEDRELFERFFAIQIYQEAKSLIEDGYREPIVRFVLEQNPFRHRLVIILNFLSNTDVELNEAFTALRLSHFDQERAQRLLELADEMGYNGRLRELVQLLHNDW